MVSVVVSTQPELQEVPSWLVFEYDVVTPFYVTSKDAPQPSPYSSVIFSAAVGISELSVTDWSLTALVSRPERKQDIASIKGINKYL